MNLSITSRFNAWHKRCAWIHVLCPSEARVLKAYLTQNTRLTRLATRVNRTYNRTNRGLNRVKLRPFECFRESRVWFLKTWYGCHVRVWLYKIIWDRIYNRTSCPRVCTYAFKRLTFDQCGLSTNHTWSSTVRHSLVRVYTVLMYTSIFMTSYFIIMSPAASAIVILKL